MYDSESDSWKWPFRMPPIDTPAKSQPNCWSPRWLRASHFHRQNVTCGSVIENRAHVCWHTCEDCFELLGPKDWAPSFCSQTFCASLGCPGKTPRDIVESSQSCVFRTWLFAIFTRNRFFAPLSRFLRSFVGLLWVLLRSFASFCVWPCLGRLRLRIAATTPTVVFSGFKRHTKLFDPHLFKSGP